MKSIWLFVKAHWKIAFFIVGAIVYFLIGQFRTSNQLLRNIAVEKKALNAAQKAEVMATEQGHDAAVAAIKQEHADTIAKLDAEQHQQAQQLTSDPAALSSFLVKAAHR